MVITIRQLNESELKSTQAINGLKHLLSIYYIQLLLIVNYYISMKNSLPLPSWERDGERGREQTIPLPFNEREITIQFHKKKFSNKSGVINE